MKRRSAVVARPRRTAGDRHYTKLSQKNYAIDMGVSSLGSCTMKHNPGSTKMVRLPGRRAISTRCSRSPPFRAPLELLSTPSRIGFSPDRHAGCRHVARGGAHGEFCGMLTIRAAQLAKGDARKAHPGAGIGARHQSGDGCRLRL